MKKIKVTLIALGVLMTVNSFAQEEEVTNGIHYGIKAGINVANVTIKTMGVSVSPSSLIGLNAGVFATIPLVDAFAIQPELAYSGLGYKVGDNKAMFNYLTLPILVKYSVEGTGFGAYLGPQIGYLLSAKTKESGTSVDIKDELKKSDFSGIVGVEYTLPMGVNLSARYQLGFSNIAKDSEIDTDLDGSLKNKAITFTVGYRF